jgi:uncharacterized membrane protein
MNLVHNERIRLLASLLNTMAGSSFTVGVAAPVAASFFYGVASLPISAIVIDVVFWLSIAAVLHSLAQYLLGALRP